MALRGELVVVHQLDGLVLANHVSHTSLQRAEEGGRYLVGLAGGPTHVREELHLQAVFLDEGGVILVLRWGRGGNGGWEGE